MAARTPRIQALSISTTPIAALSDNYVWLLEGGGERWIVDPGEAAPVIAHLGRRRPTGILITHHHADHVGGVAGLCEHYGRMAVLGPADSPFKGLSRGLRDGDSCEVCGLSAQVMAVPGHTLDHIAYLLFPADGAPVLLCGDTLFAAGCGHLFEGTAAQMHASLERLAALPDDTLVCCAHEYTLANLRFAALVEPHNEAIAERIRQCRAMREAGAPTLPGTMAQERAGNPFLRTGERAVLASAEQRAGHSLESGDAVFAVLRSWKDSL